MMGCAYCENNKWIINDKQYGIEQHVFIDEGYMYGIAVSDTASYRSASEKTKINYCPMCGRNLGDTND